MARPGRCISPRICNQPEFPGELDSSDRLHHKRGLLAYRHPDKHCPRTTVFPIALVRAWYRAAPTFLRDWRLTRVYGARTAYEKDYSRNKKSDVRADIVGRSQLDRA